MQNFTAQIFIIGVNPYVTLPPALLQSIMKAAEKDKGPIPVRLRINDKAFTQTLVKYAGEWRLYLNMPMRRAAGKDVGDEITLAVEYDGEERKTPLHPQLQKALRLYKEAKQKFERLPPSRQKEIARYINNLKSEEAVTRNVQRAVEFLLGRQRFVGRENPSQRP